MDIIAKKRRIRARTSAWKTGRWHVIAIWIAVIACLSPRETSQSPSLLGIGPVPVGGYPISEPLQQETVDADDGSESNHASSSGLEQNRRVAQAAPVEEAQTKNKSLGAIMRKSGKAAFKGGLPGFIAGVVQVLSLMWIRTIINYQSRYGTTFREAFVTLKRDGGLKRFYRGLWFALIQAPLARFVSTASNDGVEAFMASFQMTALWGPERTTVIASLVVGLWRMALMPVDTAKTVLQVDSIEGFNGLMRRVKAGKIGVLYQGAFAMAASAMLGHYPWFYTYNLLSKSDFVNSVIKSKLLRNAGIGVVASFVSDTTVNSIRVVKTTKQSMGSKHNISYLDTVRMIVAADGWKGLFGRGLMTRVFANALQSLVFTVIWRGLADHWGKRSDQRDPGEEADVAAT